MRRTCIAIVLSFLASIASFCFYLSDAPAIFLEAKDMNEILLAVFGAGISMFFTELIEYIYKKRDIEMALLNAAERVISAFAELMPVSIESIGDLNSRDKIQLLIEYFDEEYSNQVLPGLLLNSHDARDRLIREIEHCDVDECDAIAADRDSHFNRYRMRLLSSIRKSAEGYLSCFDYSRKDIDDFINICSNISSVSFPFSLACRKTILDSINHTVAEACSVFSKTAGVCRLSKLGEVGYSELLACCQAAEKSWVEREVFRLEETTYYSDNKYARELFCAIYEYADHVSPDMCRQYREAASSWFSPVKDAEQP